ncbi:MAG: alpha/beta hydrolase family protein [Gammaproteobacteria bacterium]|nr:alpha/beta hydrolase family protein [Gammaproteobacteria bacterium]
MILVYPKRTHFTAIRLYLQLLFRQTRCLLPVSFSDVRVYLLVPTLLCAQPGFSSNLWEEQQIWQEIENSVPKSQIVKLDAGKRYPVLGLYIASSLNEADGGVLILHDFGHHPNWPRVSRPLREQLPDSGWHTLAIQMPIPDPMWNFDNPADVLKESVARIESAISFMQQRNIEPLAIIAHGQSAAVVTQYLAETPQHPFKALVAISLPHQEQSEDWHNIKKNLVNLQLPMLDIYAERDYTSVTDHAHMRLVAARVAGKNLKLGPPPIAHSSKVQELAKNKTSNLWFRQIMLPGAFPDFPYNTDELVKAIRGWLSVYSR